MAPVNGAHPGLRYTLRIAAGDHVAAVPAEPSASTPLGAYGTEGGDMAEKQSGKTELVAFLTVERTEEEDGFIGAVMVTDENGYPLEYRVTTPVRPTAVQKVLYGSTLEQYVSVELCGRRLLKECRRKPPVILVPNVNLLGLSDNDSGAIVAIRRAGEAIKVEAESDKSSAVEEGRLESTEFQPVVYQASADDEEVIQAVRRLLERCFRQFDLIEAFDRVRAALKVLAQEDPRYR